MSKHKFDNTQKYHTFKIAILLPPATQENGGRSAAKYEINTILHEHGVLMNRIDNFILTDVSSSHNK